MTSPYVVSQFVIITCTCSALHSSHRDLDAPSRLNCAGKFHNAHVVCQPFLSSYGLW